MIKVRVPATSANVGPGFDCLGVALNLYNYFGFELIEEGLEFEGCNEEFMNEDNLIYTSFMYACEKIGVNAPTGLKISIENNIPISRGLGSSATCIVGGIMGAATLNNYDISKEELLRIATDIEGHPDNVAPAIYGGFSISIMDNDDIVYSDVKVADNMKFCALIPNFRLSTKESREVLPETIDYKDGIYNVGRASLLIAALSIGNLEMLKNACQDRLHQPYRGTLINDYDSVVKRSMELNAKAVFLSGAGPTIMTILPKNDVVFRDYMTNFLDKLSDEWLVKELVIDSDGVIVL